MTRVARKHIPGKWRRRALALALTGLCGTSAAKDAPHNSASERLLIESLQAVSEHNLDDALANLEQLLETRPDFKLAQLIYADLLLAKTQPIQDFGAVITDAQSRQPLLEEARARWQHHDTHPPLNAVPKYLVQMEPSQRHVIIIDARKARLYLYQNVDGEPQLIADYYVSIGKNGAGKDYEGDKKTPLGVYFITRYLDESELEDFYGKGAFPINYPNHWDRRLGRTGFNIWLHGNPLSTFSRPPRASDGCVTLSNADLEKLKAKVDLGVTPVIIADGVEWTRRESVEQTKQRFGQTLERWRSDWESGNVDRYLSHYSQDYLGQGKNFEQWASDKRRIFRNKRGIDVAMSNVSMFLYPHDVDVMVVTFDQAYRSSDLHSTLRKRQYWRRQDGRWLIIHEDSV